MMARMILSTAAFVAALLFTAAIAAPPAADRPLAEQTRANLEAAMHGEAYANLK